MTNDLKRLMQESTADAPAEPHTVAAVVDRAQRSQRRHAMRVMTGSALGVALIAGIGYAAIARPDSDRAQPVEDRPGDVVIDVDDARPAKPGQDFEVLAQLDDGLMPGFRWSPADLVTLVQGEDADDYVALSGTDGKTTTELSAPDTSQLSTPGTSSGAPVYVGQGKAVWEIHRGNRIALHIQDLATRGWTVAPLDGLDMSVPKSERVQVMGVEGDRVWFTQAVRVPGELRQLKVRSAPTDGTDEPADEVDGTVLAAAVAPGKIAWVADVGEPATVRDLATGDETDFASPNGDGCQVVLAGLSAQRLATYQVCQVNSSASTQVWSLEGEPATQLPDYHVTEGGLSDETVLFQTTEGPGGDRLRTYAYRFDTDELLDLGAAPLDDTGLILSLPTVAGGDRLTFPDPTGGNRMLLARLE